MGDDVKNCEADQQMLKKFGFIIYIYIYIQRERERERERESIGVINSHL